MNSTLDTLAFSHKGCSASLLFPWLPTYGWGPLPWSPCWLAHHLFPRPHDHGVWVWLARSSLSTMLHPAGPMAHVVGSQPVYETGHHMIARGCPHTYIVLTSLKVTGYSCARRVKCIGKCILKLANQKSQVRRA